MKKQENNSKQNQQTRINKMIYAATKQVIEEMTAVQAAIVSGSDAAAFRDDTATHSADSKHKMNRADLSRLPLITKAVIDKFGHFKLLLQEYNQQSRMGYVNYFVFDCVVKIDNASCVMKGELSIGGRPYSIGYIRFYFEKDKWQRVRFSKSGKVYEVVDQSEPFRPNAQIAYDVTSFLSDFLDKEGQNSHTAMSQNPVPSKPRKPLTQRAKANLYGYYLSAYYKKKAITPTEQL